MSVDHEPEALPSPSRAAAPVQFSADKVKPPAAAPSFNSKLRTGDIIYLTLEQDSSGGGEFEAKCAYVAAEGLADPRVGLVVKPESGNDVPADFHQCLFRVMPRLSYNFTASRIERDAGGPREAEMMNEKRQEEEQRNSAIINQTVGGDDSQIGTIVAYGDQIQLQHVHSGRFLSNAPGKLGHMEKNNRRVELAQEASEGAWFKFKPRFKIRSLGTPIYMNDQVTIQNIRSQPPHYLHAGDRRYEGEDRYEANLTMVKDDAKAPQTSWRIQRYRVVEMRERGKFFDRSLHHGDVVQLYHPEAEAFVTGTCNTNLNKLPYLMRRLHDDLQNEKNVRAKSMFRIEALDKSQGVPISHTVDEVRLRHIASGKYLTVDKSSSHFEEDMADRFEELQSMADDEGGTLTKDNYCSLEAGVLLGATLEKADIPHRQLFKLHAVTLLGGEGEDDRTIKHRDLNVRIEHTLRDERGFPRPLVRRYKSKSDANRLLEEHIHSVFLHDSRVPKEAEEESTAVMGVDGSGRVGLRMAFSQKMLDQDAVQLIPVDSRVVHMVYEVLGSFPIIDSYCERIKSFKDRGMSIGPTDPVATQLHEVLSALTISCTQMSPEAVAEWDPQTLPEGKAHWHKQALMRELKLLDMLLWLLTSIERSGISLEQLSNPENGTLMTIHHLAYICLTRAFMDNRRSELYLAEMSAEKWGRHSTTEMYLEQVRNQLGNKCGAAPCLRHMLANNEKLLETKVEEKDIQIFLNLINKKGPLKMYMDFLGAICAYRGEAVVKNQELVLVNAYSATVQTGSPHAKARCALMIETAFDLTSRKRDWTSQSDVDLRRELKKPEDYNLSTHHGDFMGKELYESGMHDIIVSWSSPGPSDGTWKPGMRKPDGTGFLFYKPQRLKYQMSSYSDTPTDLAEYGRRTGTDVVSGRKWVPLHKFVLRQDSSYVTDPIAGGRASGFDMSSSGGGRGLRRAASGHSMRSLPLGSSSPLAGAGEPELDVDASRLQLVEYYLANLELYTQLCADGSTNCIRTLERQFSYPLVLAAIADDARLPPQICEAFCDLMVNLYIRRYPHGKMAAPSTVRVYRSVEQELSIDAAGALPQFSLHDGHEYLSDTSPHKGDEVYTCPSSKKFHLLQDFISDYFERISSEPAVMENTSTNQFTLALMSCVQDLAELGFYGTEYDVQDIVDPLVTVLDGRGDLMTQDHADLALEIKRQAAQSLAGTGKERMQKKTTSQLQEGAASGDPRLVPQLTAVGGGSSAPAISTARYEKGEESARVHRAKCRICHVLGTLSNVRTDFRISVLLGKFKSELANGKSLAGRATYDHARQGDNDFWVLGEDGDEGRRMQLIRPPEIDFGNGMVLDLSIGKLGGALVNAVENIEDAASHMMGSEMGRTIDGKPAGWALTPEGLEICDGGRGHTRKGLFGDVAAKLDLASMGQGRTELVVACLDLLMYESAELFDMAWMTIVNNFRQERNFLHALERTQLLVTDESVVVYKQLQSKLSVFRHHIESYELWGRVSTFNAAVSTEKAESVKSMLKWMRCECTSEGGEADGAEPNTVNQDLLGNLHVHDIVLEALSEIDEELPVAELDPHLLEIKQLCCKFLEKFVLGNEANQNRLFPYLETKLLPLCATGLDIAPAIASLFVNNRTNCAKLSERPEILRQFAQTLREGGADKPSSLSLLDCFGKVIAPNGLPLAANQNAVLREMTRREYNPTADCREAMCLTLFGLGGDIKGDGKSDPNAGGGGIEALGDDNGLKTGLSEQDRMGYDERIELMKQFDASYVTKAGELHPARAAEMESNQTAAQKSTVRLLYHVKTLDLLGTVCLGKSPTTEIKCQQMLPLPALLATLTDLSRAQSKPGGGYGVAGYLVECSMLHLLREVYFETGISAYDSLGKDERVWELMRALKEELEALATSGSSKKAEVGAGSSGGGGDDDKAQVLRQRLIFESVLPTIKCFCDNYLPATPEVGAKLRSGDEVTLQSVNRKLNRLLSPTHYSILRGLQEAVGALVQGGHFPLSTQPTELLTLIQCGVSVRKYSPDEEKNLELNTADAAQEGAGAGAAAYEGISASSRDARAISTWNKKRPISENHAATELKTLCKALRNSFEFQYRIEDEFARLVEMVEDVKNLTDPDKHKPGHSFFGSSGDSEAKGESKARYGSVITLEQLIKRMVKHVRGQMNDSLDMLGRVRGHNMGEGNIDLMELMAKIIQNHEPFTEERAEALSANEDEQQEREKQYIEIQNSFDSWGVTEMAVDVISYSGDDAMTIGAMGVLVELLSGGNLTVQQTIFSYLTEHRNTSFFSSMRDRIRKAAAAAKLKRKMKKLADMELAGGGGGSGSSRGRSGSSSGDGGDEFGDDDEPDEWDPIRMDLVGHVLQLFAEGHNHNMQDLMRDQAQFGFRTSSNLISEAVKLLSVMAKNEVVVTTMSDDDAEDMGKVMEFLIEVVQGPCRKNQEMLVASAMVDVCKRVIVSEMHTLKEEALGPEDDDDGGDGDDAGSSASGSDEKESRHVEVSLEKEVKGFATTALASLLEGRADDVVHRLLSKKVDVGMLRHRLVQIHKGYEQIEEALGSSSKTKQAALANLGYEDGDKDSLLEQGFAILTLANGLEPFWRKAAGADGGGDGGSWGEWGSSYFPDDALRKRANTSDAEDRLLSERAKEQRRNLKAMFNEKEAYKEAYTFFDDDLRSVEIEWDGQLQRVFFPKPKECQFLTSSLREDIIRGIDYSDEDKTRDLLSKSEEIGETVAHYENLNEYGVYRYLGMRVDKLKHWSFALALMMNFIMCISLQRGTRYEYGEVVYHPAYMRDVQFCLGILQLVTSSLVLVFLLLNRAPLVYKKLQRESGRLEINIPPMQKMSAGKAFKKFRNLVFDVGSAFSLLITALAVFAVIFAIVYARFAESDVSLGGGASSIAVLLTIFLGSAGLRNWWSTPTHPLAFNYCCLYDVVMAPNTLFYVLYVMCAAIGVSGVEFAYCYHLMDLVMMNKDLQNVVKSVTGPWKQLGMTTILGVFAIYIFSLVGFYLFDDFYNAETGTDECGTMIRCFFSFLHNGLLPGGGIADYMSFELGYQPFQTGATWWDTNAYTLRTVYDLLYFIAVTVLLLNIIFGIILDEFSKLREEKAERDEAMTTLCFICEIEKGDFDDEASKRKPPQTKGFERHIGEEHNMWDYVFYLIYLKKKQSTEYTGAETYVSRCWAQDSIDWLPKKRALCMNHDDELTFEERINRAKQRTQRLTQAKVGRVAESMRQLRRRIDDMDTRVDGNITTRNRAEM